MIASSSDGQTMKRVHIALGSNINPEDNLRQALQLLGQRVRLRRLSTFYRNRPLNRPEQADFINGVVEAETDLPPGDLKRLLREIEARLERERTADRYAARTMDLDLINYDDRPAAEPDLLLPDPDIATRAFLAVPLAELAPELRLQDSEGTMRQLAAALDQSGLKPLREYTQRVRQEILLESPES
jgi:2-amino-4-hydroxy-6-hydroxymethyldihydropteridine diphosphokinase